MAWAIVLPSWCDNYFGTYSGCLSRCLGRTEFSGWTDTCWRRSDYACGLDERDFRCWQTRRWPVSS